MKKNYIAPKTTVTAVQPQALLTNSKSIWSDDTGIGFGGVDHTGGMDPASRWHNSLWDDDENEE